MEIKNIQFPIDVQTVRLIDVFAMGPFMIYIGSKKELTKTEKYALIGLGVATIVYNGINYLKNKQ